MTGDSRKIIIIGSSTGGPRILDRIFRKFPRVGAAIVIVQHMPMHINLAIREHLDAMTQMRVKIAEDGETLEEGTIYVAPSEMHLRILDNRKINLFEDRKVHFVKPSIDVAMKSLTGKPGDLLAGIVLSGMGSDGADGIRHIKAMGGITVAQNMATSIIHSMPKAAFETGMVDFVLSPEGIRSKLLELTLAPVPHPQT